MLAGQTIATFIQVSQQLVKDSVAKAQITTSSPQERFQNESQPN